MGARSTAPATRPLLIATAVMLSGFVSAYSSAAQTETTTSLALFDDAAGQSMFPDAERLSPGGRVSQCIDLGARASSPSDTVTIAGRTVTGALAADLTTRVEIGVGGRFGDCSGFVSESTLFDGPLVAFGSGTVATGWFPGTSPRRSFRVTIGLVPATSRQNQQASGEFVWSLIPGDAPPPAPPRPVPTDSPGATEPSPSATDQLGDSIGGTDLATSATSAEGTGPMSPVRPATQPDEGPGAPTHERATDAAPSSSTPSPGGEDGDDADADDRAVNPVRDPDLTLGGGLAAGIVAIVERAARAIRAVITSPQYPLLAFGLAVGFLIVQDRIDGRDPKLALASRSQRDNEVEFPDVFFGGVR